MKKIAVIGRTESIDYFRVIGCETFHVGSGRLDEERLFEILQGMYAILLVTEEIYEESAPLLHRMLDHGVTAMTIIPDLHGAPWKEGRPQSRGVAFAALRRAVVKAVGQDISNVEEI